MPPQHSLDRFLQPVSAASCCRSPESKNVKHKYRNDEDVNIPTISKVPPKPAEGIKPRKAPSRRMSSGGLLIRARRIEVQNPSSLSAEFLDLIYLILLSLSMTSWAGSITEHEERRQRTCDN